MLDFPHKCITTFINNANHSTAFYRSNASALSFMNATPNEELPSEETHHSTSYSFLNNALLPKKEGNNQL